MAAMRKTLPFRAVADFAWTSTLTTYPMVIAVAPNSPIRTMADVVETARKRPLSFSSVGVGTAHHLLGEWINSEQNVQMLHVPFKGGTAAATSPEAFKARVESEVARFNRVVDSRKIERE